MGSSSSRLVFTGIFFPSFSRFFLLSFFVSFSPDFSSFSFQSRRNTFRTPFFLRFKIICCSFFELKSFFFQFFVSVMHLKCHFSLWLGPFSEFVSFFPSFFDHIFEHLISFRQQVLFPFFRLFNTLPTDCPDFSKKK